MQPNPKDTGDFYVWEVPNQPVRVHLHHGVVDRMSAEVLRGFGAVPKRGAEVGGLLIGTIEQSGDEAGDETDDVSWIVRVVDFESVPCEYRLGPSYLFSDEESHRFESAAERWRVREAPANYAVGYFRSNTREGMRLSVEDVQLMDHFFPSSANVALLIQPYATKVSMAGFFVREGEGFPEQTPKEFPFRRRELSGRAPEPRRSLFERRPRQRGEPPAREPYTPPSAAVADSGPYQAPESDFVLSAPDQGETFGRGGYGAEGEAHPLREEGPSGKEKATSRWTWMPLSTIFLLVGLLVGFWAAITVAPQLAESNNPQGFSLNLSAARSGGNVTVRWNREAAAVRVAQKGVLEIEDGGYSKQVDLQPADLQNGTVIYQASENAVRFRLVLYLDTRLTVAETLDWAQ